MQDNLTAVEPPSGCELIRGAPNGAILNSEKNDIDLSGPRGIPPKRVGSRKWSRNVTWMSPVEADFVSGLMKGESQTLPRPPGPNDPNLHAGSLQPIPIPINSHN